MRERLAGPPRHPLCGDEHHSSARPSFHSWWTPGSLRTPRPWPGLV